MTATTRSIAALALMGLFIGLLLGLIAAGAYATWATGGDPANVGFTTIFAFAPSRIWPLGEPFGTAAMVGGALMLAGAIAAPALLHRRELTSHGSARWATEDELRRARLTARIKDINGPIYGKLGTPGSRARYLSSTEIPHSLIAAPTGSGKGVGVVIPTLLTYPGSVICLDVKGDNFAKTARQRLSMDDRVYKFAPYDEKGRTHRYNPLDDVAAAPDRRRFTEARRLAANLIVAHGGGQSFLEGSREIFAAVALVVIERRTPTIGAIYDALSQPGEAYVALRNLADEAKAPEARKILHKMSGMESRVLSTYLSVLADGGLSLWADPAVRDATEASDFSFHDLRHDPASIFIVVAPNDLIPLAPLIRLLFQQAVAIIQRSLPDPDEGEIFPVLFLLDEFISLGRMDGLATAMTTLREYGGRVMIVVQTLASLRDLYGKEGASVFLANCRMQVFMSPADEDTPEYISRAVGDHTRRTRSKSWRGGEMTTSHGERVESARLMRPEQVRMLGEGRIIALVQDLYPVAARKVVYYEDRHLAALFKAQTGEVPEPPKTDLTKPEPPEPPEFDLTEPEEPSPPKPGSAGGKAAPAGARVEAPAAATPKPQAPATTSSPPASAGPGEAGATEEDMDEVTERRVYTGLGRVSKLQGKMLEGVLHEVAAARRRRDHLLSEQVEEPTEVPASEPTPTPQRKLSHADLSKTSAAAREVNRKRIDATKGRQEVKED